jgi:hypothetical protein
LHHVHRNYRLLQSDGCKRRSKPARTRADRLIAMKTQGGGQVQTGSPAELKLAGRFVEAGFTDAQPSSRRFGEDTRITTITSLCKTTTILTQTSPRRWAARPWIRPIASCSAKQRRKRAPATAPAVRGFARRRPPAPADQRRHAPSDVLPQLRDPDLARREFAALPAAARALLAGADYTAAEARCPQRMPIAR